MHGAQSSFKSSAKAAFVVQADYDYPDLMDSFPSNHKKGYKKRQTKSVADEEEEEEENTDDMQEFMALPFNHDQEDPDLEYDPKVKYPLPIEVRANFHLACHCIWIMVMKICEHCTGACE